MLTLYHGTTSVCACKVRIVFAEKGEGFEGKMLDLGRGDQFDPAYAKINPNALVPTLDHDGRIVPESSVIMQYLEDLFPEPSLTPADPFDRARMRLWMKRIDDPIHPATGVLTHGIAFRADFLRLPEAEKEARFAKIPMESRRVIQRAVYTDGLAAPVVIGAAKAFDALFRDMEAALAAEDWLAGPAYSLADAAATPYANRIHMLRLDSVFMKDRPRLAGWYERVRARPSFAEGIGRWVTGDDLRKFGSAPADAPERVARLLAAA
ncbi:MAG: glutathione S-transferase family protein [Alphaproteobacteria bacterium]|nr:glutathione S-transferase family protein [Alphaproteobacteria bacterium]